MERLSVVALVGLLLAATTEDVFTINSMADFWVMHNMSQNGVFNQTVELMCDLDFLGVTNFTPIGQREVGRETNEDYFSGTFHGNGHTIRNLVVKNNFSHASDAAFFCILSNATVTDLHFDKSCYFHGAWAAALSVKAAHVFTTFPQRVIIRNVSNSGTVISAGAAGGIVAGDFQYSPEAHVTFEGCWNDGNVSIQGGDQIHGLSFCSAGGIVGVVSYSAVFLNCHNYGPVHAQLSLRYHVFASSAGGIVGQFFSQASNNPEVLIESCSNHAPVFAYVPMNAAADYNSTVSSGGIVGSLPLHDIAGFNVEIRNCTNNGDITSLSENATSPVFAAGIMGQASILEEKSVIVKGCYNAGNVNASSSTTSGAVLSSGIICCDWAFNNSYLENCTNEGTVFSDKEAYGIVNGANSVNMSVNAGVVEGKEKTFGIVGIVSRIESSTSAGELKCESNGKIECVCGFGSAKQSDGFIYKEDNVCNQEGEGMKTYEDEHGFLVIMKEDGNEEYLSDYLNERMNGKVMKWTRDMKLGFEVKIEYCGKKNRKEEMRGYVIARSDESLRSAIEREGDGMKWMIDESKAEPSSLENYVMKINGELIDIETVMVSDECRIEVTEMNGCVEYFCDGEIGTVETKSKCNSNDEVNQTCIDDECVTESKEGGKEDTYVEIELGPSVRVDSLNMTEVTERIRVLCGEESKGMKIGWRIDEETGTIRILVYVKDESVAHFVVDTVNDALNNEGCDYGVLCDAVKVNIVTPTISLSETVELNDSIFIYVLLVLLSLL